MYVPPMPRMTQWRLCTATIVLQLAGTRTPRTQNKHELKNVGVLGARPNDDKEAACLNRVASWRRENRLEYEADKKTAEKLIED